MEMFFKCMSTHDLNMYFGGSVVFWKADGGILKPLLVQEVRINDVVGVVYEESEDRQVIVKPDDLIVLHPELGHFVGTKGLMFVSRSPSQCYKRGIKLSNLRYEMVGKEGYVEVSNKGAMRFLELAANNITPSRSAFLRSASRKGRSRIGKYFGLANNNLYYTTKVVGNYRDGKFELTTDTPFIRERLVNLIGAENVH